MKTRTSKSTRAACASQHFGIWCVDPQWHRDTFAAVKSGLFKPQVSEVPAMPLTYDVVNGVAVIPVDGMLTKGKSSYGGTSMMELAALVREADRDPTVTRIMLEIDSPGGTYVGIEAISTAMKRLTKPSIAKVSDWAASGALWLAVHADEVVVNRNGEVGSIGAFTVLLDTSKADEQDGFNYILVTSGELKGAGTDGRIKPEQVEKEQKAIDRIKTQFVAAIAEQRGLTPEAVNALADGRMFTADESLQLGLIDRVIDEVDAETFLQQEQDMTREEFVSYASAHPDDLKEAAKGLISTEVNNALTAAKPQPATLEDLEKAFPDDPAFVIAQAKAKATIADAKASHADKLVSDLKAARDQVAQLRVDLAKADPATAGVANPVDAPAPDNAPEQNSGATTAANVAKKRREARAAAFSERK